MISKTSRRFFRKLAAILLPTLAIAVGLLSIVAISYWSKTKQSDKYALPADRSAKSMLAYLRKLDTAYDPRTSMISESNLPSVSEAVRRASEALDQNRSDLSPTEQREADYYRLHFGYLNLLTGSGSQDAEEWKVLLAKAHRYVTEATQVSSRESTIATYALACLDSLGHTDEGIELANLIEHKFADLPAGQTKTNTLTVVTSLRNRWLMLGTELDLTTVRLDRQPISVRDLRGKVVLIEFWSTTCGPCLADFPALKRIYSSYHDQGFEVLAVCLHASAAKIETFAKEHQLPWIHVCHDHIEGNDEWASKFGIYAVPTTMLVDQNGKVLKFGVRPLHSSRDRDLEENLKQLLSR